MAENPPAAFHGVIAAPREDLCLDFVNTRCWRGRGTPTEELHGIDDMLAWSVRAGIVDAAIGGRFDDWRRIRPRAAAQVFATAIGVREILFRLFAAVASAEAVDRDDLDALNDALEFATPRSRIAWRDGAFVWAADLRPGIAALLSPVLWSASDLLAGSRRARVRQCANPECRWVFLDDSKSGNRRWCSMASCGNRAKAHRHYLKAKASRTGGAV